MRRTLLVLVLASMVGVLPAFLLGGLSVLIGAELRFGEFALGAAVASFFVGSIILSYPAGILSERIGPVRTLAGGLAVTEVALLGVALGAYSCPELVGWIVLAGLGNAVIQVGANHLLALDVGDDRQGLAFGIKQSSIPAAGIVAGLALPLVGATLGWRWAYALCVIPGLLVLLLLPRHSTYVHRPRATLREGDASIAALAVLSLAAGVGTAAGNALNSFTVESAVSSGFAVAAAGLLLSGGSVVGLLVRVGSGWLADRLGRGSLAMMTALLGTGAVGFVVLALAAVPIWIVVGTVLAFVGGWGYQGLVLLAVSRTNPHAPGAAMAIARVGPSAGAALGPFGFGALVQLSGYPFSWSIAAVAAAVAAVLTIQGRRMLLPYRPSQVARQAE